MEVLADRQFCLAELFSDQRDRVSRRTTIAQLCALVACAFAIVLVSFASGHTAGHAASELGLLAVVGVFALIGATSGLNKVLVTWRERPQRVLVYVAGLGIVFSLAAWVSALSVTANIWSQWLNECPSSPGFLGRGAHLTRV